MAEAKFVKVRAPKPAVAVSNVRRGEPTRKNSGPKDLAAYAAAAQAAAKEVKTVKLPSVEVTKRGRVDIHDFLRQVTASVSVNDEKAGTPRVDPEALKGALRLLKGVVFKADHPYRTRLGFWSNLATSGVGLVNAQFNVNNLGSAQEWTSIDSLFDEVFIHSMELVYEPLNLLSGGMPVGSAGAAYDMGYGTPTASSQMSAGLVMCSLYHGAGTYSAASGLLCNPSHKLAHSGMRFKYTWRNNVRFEPHGIAMSSSTTESWQGWTLINNIGNHGGTVQMRTFNDVQLGDLSHVYTLGACAVIWDCSFRARA